MKGLESAERHEKIKMPLVKKKKEKTTEKNSIYDNMLKNKNLLVFKMGEKHLMR